MALFVFASHGIVRADIDSYAIFKVANYQQVDSSQPTVLNTPNAYYFEAQLFSTDSGEIVTNAIMTAPDSTIYPMQGTPATTALYYKTPYYGDEMGLDALYPNGAYMFSVNDGTDSGVLTIPTEDLFTSTIPYFTGDTWSRIQSVDATLPLKLCWNSFVPNPDATSAYIFVRILDSSFNCVYTTNYISAGVTNICISAECLEAGTTYQIQLLFSDRADDVDYGFYTDAPATSGFDVLTYTSLVTLPPKLHVAAGTNSIILSWSVSASNYALESATEPNLPIAWSPVTNAPAVIGDSNVVVLPTSAQAQYFQLCGDVDVYLAAQPPPVGFETFYSTWNGSNATTTGTGVDVYCNPCEYEILVMATNMLNDTNGLFAYAAPSRPLMMIETWIGGRDANGTLYANTNGFVLESGSNVIYTCTNAFPHGMPWLVNKLHGMGFMVGLYTELQPPDEWVDCGMGETTSGEPYTQQDANTFASWGVDAVEADFRDNSGSQSMEAAQESMMIALKSTGRPIYYLMFFDPLSYAGSFEPWMTQANGWRVCAEYGLFSSDKWTDVMSHWDFAYGASANMRPGHTTYVNAIGGSEIWTAPYDNNVGQLEVTTAAMFQSPMIWCQDPLQWWPGWAVIATNQYARQIQTDPWYRCPWLVATNGADIQAWAKSLASGNTALALLNRGNFNESITFSALKLGASPNKPNLFTDCFNYTNFIGVNSLTFCLSSNTVGMWIMSANTNGAAVTRPSQ